MTGVTLHSHVRYQENRGPQHVRAYISLTLTAQARVGRGNEPAIVGVWQAGLADDWVKRRHCEDDNLFVGRWGLDR